MKYLNKKFVFVQNIYLKCWIKLKNNKKNGFSLVLRFLKLDQNHSKEEES